jgi:hypothetical protein
MPMPAMEASATRLWARMTEGTEEEVTPHSKTVLA